MNQSRWLLVTISTAGAQTSLRMFTWRRLKGLGALYLQQSVCLLPDQPAIYKQVQRLIAKVHSEGGNGRCLKITLVDSKEEQNIIAEMRAACDKEYEEVLERLPSFFQELQMEIARGNTTYAEVEESEADLRRFQEWVKKIEERDYFGAPQAAKAETELKRAATALAKFEAVALEKDTDIDELEDEHLDVKDVGIKGKA